MTKFKAEDEVSVWGYKKYPLKLRIVREVKGLKVILTDGTEWVASSGKEWGFGNAPGYKIKLRQPDDWEKNRKGCLIELIKNILPNYQFENLTLTSLRHLYNILNPQEEEENTTSQTQPQQKTPQQTYLDARFNKNIEGTNDWRS